MKAARHRSISWSAPDREVHEELVCVRGQPQVHEWPIYARARANVIRERFGFLERPNPLSYLRRLRLRCRECGRLEQASYEFRCAAGPRPPARDSSRVLKEG